MKRALYQALVNWKNSPNRKPLILQGARQVGKTWLMKGFGKAEFEKVVYINFESSERLKMMFSVDFDIKRLISIIEIEVNHKIDSKSTLLIFDKIQEAEKGLTALKYFYEQAPQYYIIAAGSWLGVSLQKNNSFPIKVKAEENLKSKSLKVFVEKYNSNTAIRSSMSNYRVQSWLTNLPLYGINGL
jgi:uncharacterized protein